MFSASSLRFELLVRISRSAIAAVDSYYSLLARRRGNAMQVPDVGTALVIDSGGSALEAWLVHAQGVAGAGLLILPGIGDRMVYWRRAQAMLAQSAVTSLIFHYSGYVGSQGRTTPAAMELDVHAAWTALQQAVAPGTPLFVLGFSLGTGVLAEVAAGLVPMPAGLVLSQPYTSFRKAARRVARPVPWLAGLVPDIWKTSGNVREVTAPLLIVHGEGDVLFPSAMAQEIAEQARAAGTRVTLVLIPGYPHNAVYQRVPEDYWAPVLRFLLSSVRACE